MAKPQLEKQIEVRTEAISLGIAWIRDGDFGGRTLVVNGLCYPLDLGQHCPAAHGHMLREIAKAYRVPRRTAIARTPDLGVLL